MPGPILLQLPNPSFDLRSLLKEAIEQQRDIQAPTSPTLSDVPSSLSSLTPSPCHSALPPLPLFLDPSDLTPSPSALPKKMQSKKSKKVTPAQRQARRNAAANASRKARRSCKGDKLVKARPEARLKHLGHAKAIVLKNFDAEKLPAARTGYIGLDPGRRRRRRRGPVTLEQAVGKHRLSLVEWDGSFSAGIVDKDGRVVAIMAGHPDDKDWPSLQAQATHILEDCRSICQTSKDMENHRRGKFVVLNCGVSYGGGQTAPGNLHSEPPNEHVFSKLNTFPVFERVAGFASSVMATWAPKLYEYYRSKTQLLHQMHPHLVRIFPSSIFSAFSYNLGPQTVCYEHTDPGNVAFGECSVTPFGDYDYTKGGHLILWNLGVVIEFPPGSTILFPSAVVTHSNVAVAKSERRYSFVQYTSGGLFRWVDQGFQTQSEHWGSLSSAELKEEKERIEGMWEFGLSLMPKVHYVDNAVNK